MKNILTGILIPNPNHSSGRQNHGVFCIEKLWQYFLFLNRKLSITFGVVIVGEVSPYKKQSECGFNLLNGSCTSRTIVFYT